MSYRPYPNPDRALHQLDRHAHAQPLTEVEQQMAAGAQAALVAGAAAIRPLMEAMHQVSEDITKRALAREAQKAKDVLLPMARVHREMMTRR